MERFVCTSGTIISGPKEKCEKYIQELTGVRINLRYGKLYANDALIDSIRCECDADYQNYSISLTSDALRDIKGEISEAQKYDFKRFKLIHKASK